MNTDLKYFNEEEKKISLSVKALLAPEETSTEEVATEEASVEE